MASFDLKDLLSAHGVSIRGINADMITIIDHVNGDAVCTLPANLQDIRDYLGV